MINKIFRFTEKDKSVVLVMSVLLLFKIGCTSSTEKIKYEKNEEKNLNTLLSQYKFDWSKENCNTYPELQKGKVHRKWLETYSQIRNCLSKELFNEKNILNPIYLNFSIRKDLKNPIRFVVSNVKTEGSLEDKTQQCIKSEMNKMQLKMVQSVDVRLHLNPIIPAFINTRRLIIEKELLQTKIKNLENIDLVKGSEKKRLLELEDKIKELEKRGYNTNVQKFEIEPTLYCLKKAD